MGALGGGQARVFPLYLELVILARMLRGGFSASNPPVHCKSPWPDALPPQFLREVSPEEGSIGGGVETSCRQELAFWPSNFRRRPFVAVSGWRNAATPPPIAPYPSGSKRTDWVLAGRPRTDLQEEAW